MTDSGPRFCPRCGTARVGDLPFCPRCGLNVGELPDDAMPRDRPVWTDDAPALERATPLDEPPPVAQRSVVDDRVPGAGLRIPPLALVAGLVIVGLLVIGFVPRLNLGGGTASPQPGAIATVGAPSAPIVGLTILSPSDGQAVGTKEVLVIGTAPPGVRITRDVSFGFDQHTDTDGTGHWVLKVGLNDGDNKLTFRIGDDHSTEKMIRVIYQPPPGG